MSWLIHPQMGVADFHSFSEKRATVQLKPTTSCAALDMQLQLRTLSYVLFHDVGGFKVGGSCFEVPIIRIMAHWGLF